MNLNDPTSFLDIDFNNLEEELKNQAVLFYQVYSAYSDACEKYDMVSEELKVKEAEHGLAFRTSQSGKVTEKMVEEYLTLNSEIKSVRKDKLLARSEREILAGLVKAMEHRRDSLKSASFTSRKEALPEKW
jgi:hypothetical protein